MAGVLLRLGLATTLSGAVVASAVFAERALLPREGAVAEGLRVDGVAVPTGRGAGEVARERAEAALSREIVLTDGGAPVLARTARELGATVDVDALERRIASVGHAGSLWDRLDAAGEARRGALNVPVPIHLPVESLAEALLPRKEALDRRSRPAKLRVTTGEVVAHEDGAYVDLYATAEAAGRALGEAGGAVEIAIFREPPAASTEAARTIETDTVVSTFETVFSYGDPGRAKNVERAASLLDGTILMPGQAISFNEIVGARSVENGFFPAPEIYRGEMRAGIGGGSCQVASTLYAAAFFAGLDIVERVNHSRPSGYIRLGLDATVSYPVLDLKIQNPFDFPIVVASHVEKTGVLRFELLGGRPAAKVELSTATVGFRNYDRKVKPAPWLPEGEFRLSQKGKRGVTVKRVRKILDPDGDVRVEEDLDTYPPTQEVYLVAPGVDVDRELPPLPEDA